MAMAMRTISRLGGEALISRMVGINAPWTLDHRRAAGDWEFRDGPIRRAAYRRARGIGRGKEKRHSPIGNWFQPSRRNPPASSGVVSPAFHWTIHMLGTILI